MQECTQLCTRGRPHARIWKLPTYAPLHAPKLTQLAGGEDVGSLGRPRRQRAQPWHHEELGAASQRGFLHAGVEQVFQALGDLAAQSRTARRCVHKVDKGGCDRAQGRINSNQALTQARQTRVGQRRGALENEHAGLKTGRGNPELYRGRCARGHTGVILARIGRAVAVHRP